MNVSRTELLPVSTSPRRLASWKAIAEYFDCDERTAKRWERERGLPVHRAPGHKRSGVFAYTSELDCWLQSSAPAQNPHSREYDKEPKTGQLSVLHADVDAQLPIGIEPASVSTQPALVGRLATRRWLPWTVSGMAVLVAGAVLLVHSAQRAAPSKSAGILALSSVPQHVPSPGAEELFLRGRYLWNLRTADGLDKAIDLYTQAIVKDPAYAEAYAGLAEAYDLLPQFGRAEMASSLNKARDAADRAISLNPNLADAHAAKAFALCYGDWDIAGSDAEFQRALALDPNSSMTHHWYASTLHDRGEASASLHQIAEALHLDPTSAAIATDAAFFQADYGNLDAGLKALKEIERTQPTLASPPDFLRAIDFSRGDFPGYIAETRRYAEVTHNPDEMALADAVALGWARAGRRGMLEERVRFMKAAFDHGSERGFGLGETLLLLGRRQEALVYFKAALNHHDLAALLMQKFPWAPSLKRTPGYVEFFAEARQRAHMGSLAFGKDIPASSEFPWSPPDLDVAQVQ
jgi:tetratricopeptide (TPR) repeat protein